MSPRLGRRRTRLRATASTMALAVAALAAAALTSSGVLAEQTASVSGVVENGATPLTNAAIYLLPLDRQPGSAGDAPRTIDQIHLAFVPSVLVVLPGTEVTFRNSDPQLHNVFGPGWRGSESFNLGTYDQSAQRNHTFTIGGLNVVLCHIHPEMAAYVIVAETDFKTVTAANGTFRIEGVPPGRYELHAWHARRWRDELVREITVPASGLTGLMLRIGAKADGEPGSS